MSSKSRARLEPERRAGGPRHPRRGVEFTRVRVTDAGTMRWAIRKLGDCQVWERDGIRERLRAEGAISLLERLEQRWAEKDAENRGETAPAVPVRVQRGVSLLLFLVIFAATGLLTLVWPWLAWPLAPGPDQLVSGAAAVLAVFLYVRQRRSSRSRRLHAGLRKAASARAAGTWLNRDDHQVFIVCARWWPWCRLLLINRMAEDSTRELGYGQDEVPLPVEVFTTIPFMTDVQRHDA